MVQKLPENLIETLRKFALLAGDEIMKIYRADDNSSTIAFESKADESPVTLADKAADRLIYDGLKAAYPDIPIVTEEQIATQGESFDRFFIVDPLDGTKEFIHKRGDFTVNIALIENAAPVAGIVYAPAKDRLFYTTLGGQAVEESGPFEINHIGEHTPLNVATPDMAALRIVASKSHRDAATDRYLAQFNAADLKSAGSSLKICLVASGEADFYPRIGPTMEWDTAAGDAILRAAGGQMVDLTDLNVLKYGKENFLNPFFAAFAPGVRPIKL